VRLGLLCVNDEPGTYRNVLSAGIPAARVRRRAPCVRAPTQRWLSAWTAVTGTPADEVVLAWSPGTGTVVTAGTSDREHERGLLRLVCAIQALGGGDLPIPNQPELPRAARREIDRIVAADDLDGYALGYSYLADGQAITVTSVDDPVNSFTVRPVQDWGHTTYASEQHPEEELTRAH
jgi:hypothetical protein